MKFGPTLRGGGSPQGVGGGQGGRWTWGAGLRGPRHGGMGARSAALCTARCRSLSLSEYTYIYLSRSMLLSCSLSLPLPLSLSHSLTFYPSHSMPLPLYDCLSPSLYASSSHPPSLKRFKADTRRSLRSGRGSHGHPWTWKQISTFLRSKLKRCKRIKTYQGQIETLLEN